MSTTQDLTTWAQERLTKLYSPSEGDDAAATFEATCSPDINISVNGESTTREKLKQDITGASIGKVELNWDNCIAVPKDDQNPNDAGIVAGFVTLTRHLPFRIRAATAQSQSIVCFQAKVESGPASTDQNGWDNRRIVELHQTVLHKPFNANIHATHPGNTTT
ncbi:hypothetical protein BD410DRAFT_901901 [Rickenella mellea]|uniref:Uncharacterized protein n=1 Tax=Rickenella mellea TaxID=50990 RepID=A0A4Y7PPX4_9AGAM|nr:hypothetical protein BD410DRAFT_901901 [Rickenella mellea]